MRIPAIADYVLNKNNKLEVVNNSGRQLLIWHSKKLWWPYFFDCEYDENVKFPKTTIFVLSIPYNEVGDPDYYRGWDYFNPAFGAAANFIREMEKCE